MATNISLMNWREFKRFEQQFSDDFLPHVYHNWAYQLTEVWGDFLILNCMGGEL